MVLQVISDLLSRRLGMDAQRQGDIAKAMVKHNFAERGLRVNRSDIITEVGNLFLDLDEANPQLKLAPKELLEFYLIINKEIMVGFEPKAAQRLMLR